MQPRLVVIQLAILHVCSGIHRCVPPYLKPFFFNDALVIKFVWVKLFECDVYFENWKMRKMALVKTDTWNCVDNVGGSCHRSPLEWIKFMINGIKMY